jgi:putative Mg2+ transporter-C (MgtC) family protein
MGQRILETLASEFTDAADAAQITRILVRLSMAALLGGLVGRQPERMRKVAGVRTHILVAMGRLSSCACRSREEWRSPT